MHSDIRRKRKIKEGKENGIILVEFCSEFKWILINPSLKFKQLEFAFQFVIDIKHAEICLSTNDAPIVMPLIYFPRNINRYEVGVQ